MAFTPNDLVPEFAVSDIAASLRFYVDLLGFTVEYDRPEEGFAYLSKGGAQLMLDQEGVGRTFDTDAPRVQPYGRGVNLQISIPNYAAVLAALRAGDVPLYLEPEERSYRVGDQDIDQRQFVVADPDGYLLRFTEK